MLPCTSPDNKTFLLVMPLMACRPLDPDKKELTGPITVLEKFCFRSLRFGKGLTQPIHKRSCEAIDFHPEETIKEPFT